MLLKPSSLRKTFLYFIQGPKFYGGGSPPATPTQTTQTVNQNNIPAELLPYTKNMLNKAQGLTQEAYQPYSTNAGDYVAPFSPLQQTAQTSATNLQTPGQFAPASQMAGISGLGSMTAGQNYQNQATDPNAVGAYMNPYLQQSLAPQLQLLNQQFGIQQAQQQGAATQAGAFGGSREALQGGLINQNQALAQQQMIGQGYNEAFNQAQQAQQFGANLGLQGYGQGIQAAGQLGQLGTGQLAAETGVMNTQNTIGGQQQAQQQQAINQSVLNYQNAQQYPYMQLGFMSDLIRGTPTGNSTQTQYQAQPGMASQIGGLAATGLGAYTALKADGGVIKDKGYKSGGIVGYKVGGEIEESMRSKLEDLDKPHLSGIIQNNESPEMTELAKEVLATKLAKGGIVAFKNGDQVDEQGNPLLKKHKKISELQSEVAPVVNKTDMGIGARSPFFAVDEELLPSPAASTLELPTTAQTPTIAEEGLASPTGIAGVPEAPGIPLPQKAVVPEVSSDELDAITAQKQIAYDEAKKEADISLPDRVQQRKDLEEKFLGKDTGTEDYRADLAKQKADAPDELRQQMGMRLMEFGANWASTPGAPLVAGMKALRETMPSVMQDTKEHKAMMKDLDKSTYMLEHSIRLDAMGQIDAAAAEREKAAANVMKHEEAITTLAVDKYKLDQTVAENAKNRASQESIAEGNNAATLASAKERYNGVDKTGVTGTAALQGKISLLKSYEGNPMYARSPEGKAAIKQLRLDIATASDATPVAGSIFPVGTKKNGYVYKGGDPNSESSWKEED